MATINIPGLEKSDFAAMSAPKLRLIWCEWGQTGTGKSSFWLSGPRPTCGLDLDHRLERVADPDDPKLLIHRINLPECDPMSRSKDDTVKKQAEKEWANFVKNYDAALKSSLLTGGVRTIGVDTATELLDLRLLSEHGKLMGIQPRDRGGANMDLIELIRRGEKYNANVVWVQHAKEDWKNVIKVNPRTQEEYEVGYKTGEWIIDGFGKTPSIAQVVAVTSYDSNAKDPRARFVVTLQNCKVNARLNGQKFTSLDWAVWDNSDKETPIINYGPLPYISSLIVPTTSPNDWT